MALTFACAAFSASFAAHFMHGTRDMLAGGSAGHGLPVGDFGGGHAQ
jgi:hypothetical protein